MSNELTTPNMLMAQRLAESTLVPQHFKKPENALIAVEIAKRLNTDPFTVMQNLYIVNNKPSWSSQYIISLINNCGKFTSLRWKMSGEGDKRECIAYTTEKETGEILESPVVTIEMAKKEGWFQKTGSKWQTMPEMMLRYRAAAFFGRLYLPEILNGMYMIEEMEDIAKAPIQNTEANLLNEMFLEGELVQEEIINNKEEVTNGN